MIRLIVFDCDGTLVDSQHLIVDAMSAAFEDQGLPKPSPDAVRHVIGLSLPVAIARLLPEAGAAEIEVLVDRYKESFSAMRQHPLFHEPLFDGARDTLEALNDRGQLLAIATGKSDRGVARVLEHHGLEKLFTSLQTADRHPSKPHPGMIEAAMDETGSAPHETLMVGDTSYDMEMARAARVGAIGVGWGYHSTPLLERSGADVVIERFDQLLALAVAA